VECAAALDVNAAANNGKPSPDAPPLPKKRGRPLGSKNKPRAVVNDSLGISGAAQPGSGMARDAMGAPLLCMLCMVDRADQ
jgi:hypothetical protein